MPFFLFWKTHHIFFASLTVDARQTEINRTFSLLTLLDRLKRDIFSPFLILVSYYSDDERENDWWILIFAVCWMIWLPHCFQEGGCCPVYVSQIDLSVLRSLSSFVSDLVDV